MHCHKAGTFHTYGADFPFAGKGLVDPHPGCSIDSFAAYSIISQRADHGFFQTPDILLHTKRMALHVDHRIGHKLTRTVKSDIAATPDVNKFYASRGQILFRNEHVGFLSVAADGEHRLMLYKNQSVVAGGKAGLLAIHHRGEKGFLTLQHLAVSDGAGIYHVQKPGISAHGVRHDNLNEP